MSALDKLDPNERMFVELLAERNLPAYECYRIAFDAGNRRVSSCGAAASQLRREIHVAAAICEVMGTKRRESVADLSEIREFFTGVQRGACTQLADYVTWETVPGRYDGQFETAPVVIDPLDIPPEFQPLVKNFELMHDGRYRVIFWPDPKTGDRIKSAELLAKMLGGFIEQVQLSADVKQSTITQNMTPEQATDIYRQMLRKRGG